MVGFGSPRDSMASCLRWRPAAILDLIEPEIAPSNKPTVKNWIGLSSVLRPLQHSIGYMGAGFYRFD